VVKTIKKDPLDIIPDNTSTTDKTPTTPKTYTKSHFTVHLPDELQERMKNAVYWTPRLTLARLCEDAIEKELAMYEAENGGRFEDRESDLRGGRPIK